MQNRKIIFRDNSILNLKLTFFPYWFLLAHRAQKTGGARATTSLLLWGKRKGIEKTIPTSFFVLLGWWPPRWRQQPLTFLFRVFPGTESETPCRANLNWKLQPALQIPRHLHQEGEPKKEKPPNGKSKISILEVVHRLWHHLPGLAKPSPKLSDSRN